MDLFQVNRTIGFPLHREVEYETKQRFEIQRRNPEEKKIDTFTYVSIFRVDIIDFEIYFRILHNVDSGC